MLQCGECLTPFDEFDGCECPVEPYYYITSRCALFYDADSGLWFINGREEYDRASGSAATMIALAKTILAVVKDDGEGDGYTPYVYDEQGRVKE